MSADDIALYVRLIAEDLIQKHSYRILYGTWLAAETEDANLSKILIEGFEVRWAPKLAHVTGLTAGNQVMCIKGPGVPVTILGAIQGDITKAKRT